MGRKSGLKTSSSYKLYTCMHILLSNLLKILQTAQSLFFFSNFAEYNENNNCFRTLNPKKLFNGTKHNCRTELISCSKYQVKIRSPSFNKYFIQQAVSHTYQAVNVSDDKGSSEPRDSSNIDPFRPKYES